jgi:transposase-like protein
VGADYAGWQKRDLSTRRYVYVWADAVYLQARMKPQAGHQRCTVHKTATVLDKLPKSVQPAAKADLRKVTTAATAITLSADKYGAKYEKAATCLLKDRDSLLTFSRLSIGVMSWMRQ